MEYFFFENNLKMYARAFNKISICDSTEQNNHAKGNIFWMNYSLKAAMCNPRDDYN